MKDLNNFFLQSDGDSGIFILEASASLLLQWLFPKTDSDGQNKAKGWVLVTGLQTFSLPRFLRGEQGTPWAKARLPGQRNWAKRSAETGDFETPGSLHLPGRI